MPFDKAYKMSKPIETERKFLIRMPSIDDIISQSESRVKYIEQTYLTTNDNTNARVRRITEGGKISFVKTVKQRISVLSCYEEEYEINEKQYKDELKKADKTRKTVVKTRYCFPYAEHIIEIDVYPFWTDRAILEVELKNEDEEISIPSFIEIVKEVSDDKRYKNTNIAIEIPEDKI